MNTPKRREYQPGPYLRDVTRAALAAAWPQEPS